VSVGAIAIVTAAGKGERFGGGKLIAPLEGEPLLNRTVRSLLDGGAGRVVVVAAPDSRLDGVTLLGDPRVALVINPDPSRGMFSSIQTGVAAAGLSDSPDRAGDPILVLPGDMPFVKATTVAAVIARAAANPGKIVSPRHRGSHGHPVALPGGLRREILDAPPSLTLAMLIESHASERTFVDVDDRGIVRDVDERADLSTP